MKYAKVTWLLVLTVLLTQSVLVGVNAQQGPYFFKIHISTTAPRADEINYIVPQLRRIGIDVEVHTMDYPTLAALRDGKTTPFDSGGWDAIGEFISTSPDPDMSYYYLSSNIPPSGIGNFASYKNTTSDKLLLSAQAELNQTKRAQIYSNWLKIVDQDVPYVILYQTKGMILFSNHVVDGIDQVNNWYMSYGTDNIRLAAYVNLQQGRDTYVVATYYRSPNFIGPLAFSFCRGIASSMVKVQGLTGQVYPELAQSWDFSKDGLQATFHLRRDAVWTDGVPFTSKDVKFTYDSIMNPALAAARGSLFRGIIKSVDAPDNYTVVINLNQPYAPLLTTLGFRYGNEIVPYHSLANVPLQGWKNSTYNLKPGALPSLGPYMPIEKVEGQYTTWQRNDLWFGWGRDGIQPVNKAPKYVKHVVIPEGATALAALEKGDVDFLEHFYKLDAEYPRLSKASGVQVLATPTYYLEDLHINLNNPILSNKWVRQAISYAVPRENYVKDVLNGLGIATSLPIALTSWAYDPAVKSPTPYDLTMAKALMEKAGYKSELLNPPVQTPYITYIIGAVVVVALAGAIYGFILRKRRK